MSFTNTMNFFFSHVSTYFPFIKLSIPSHSEIRVKKLCLFILSFSQNSLLYNILNICWLQALIPCLQFGSICKKTKFIWVSICINLFIICLYYQLYTHTSNLNLLTEHKINQYYFKLALKINTYEVSHNHIINT